MSVRGQQISAARTMGKPARRKTESSHLAYVKQDSTRAGGHITAP